MKMMFSIAREFPYLVIHLVFLYTNSTFFLSLKVLHQFDREISCSPNSPYPFKQANTQVNHQKYDYEGKKWENY